MAVIRILGIDPGTHVVGFGCLELAVTTAAAAPDLPMALRAANAVRAGVSARVRVVDCGVLGLGGRHDRVPERLGALAEQFAAVLARLQPHELALEEAFHGKSVQAALRIGEARGVILAAAARVELAIHQYSPARVKRCVTGRGNADKAAVADMVLRQLGGAGAVLPVDATDALAVAFTRWTERESPVHRESAIGASDASGPAVAWRPRRRR